MYWANIDRYYYANQKEDAKQIGFDDHFIYDELDKKPEKRSIPREQLLHAEALKAFKIWEGKEDKTEY